MRRAHGLERSVLLKMVAHGFFQGALRAMATCNFRRWDSTLARFPGCDAR